MRISDWSSDVCSSDLDGVGEAQVVHIVDVLDVHGQPFEPIGDLARDRLAVKAAHLLKIGELGHLHPVAPHFPAEPPGAKRWRFPVVLDEADVVEQRSEEHTSELQSLMRISYAVFCLKKKQDKQKKINDKTKI